MGVLYHRRSPLDHLYQLKNQLVAEGELVLETLVVKAIATRCWCRAIVMRADAQRGFIPSAEALKCWLERCGFVDVKIADMCVTSLEEQRRTDWMTSESLAEFLDPERSQQNGRRLSGALRAVLTEKPLVAAIGLACAGPNSPVARHRQFAAHRPSSRSAGSVAHSRFHRTPTPAAPPLSASRDFQVADRLAEQRRIGGERLGHHLPLRSISWNHATVG